MTAAKQNLERAIKRDRSERLWSVVFVTAAFGVVALWRDRTVLAATLPGLISSAVFLVTVAVYVSRDGRERLTGLLAPVPVLAVGLPSLRSQSPGWTLTAVLAVMAAFIAAFVGWQRRRTPTRRVPQTAAVPLAPVKPLEAPVAGHCRWCGLRAAAVICGGRSDGGPCEPAEAAASDPAATP